MEVEKKSSHATLLHEFAERFPIDFASLALKGLRFEQAKENVIVFWDKWFCYGRIAFFDETVLLYYFDDCTGQFVLKDIKR